MRQSENITTRTAATSGLPTTRSVNISLSGGRKNVKRNLSPDEICAIQALSENEIGTGLALFARDVFPSCRFTWLEMNLA